MGSTAPEGIEQFMDDLRKQVDPSRLSKSLKMLRADRFQLFCEVDDDGVVGVVASQTDWSLRYSCQLGSDGGFSCCTQNLNVCGGLRGKLCKHLLVLLVGLVRSGELEGDRVLSWVGAANKKKPVLDRDRASEIFIRYRGAEAGEVDWRPTETLPEDYYAF